MKNKLLLFSKSFLFIGTVCLASGIGNFLEKGTQANRDFIDPNLTLSNNEFENEYASRTNVNVSNYEEFVDAVEDKDVSVITLENDIKVPSIAGDSINESEQIILHGVHDLDGQGHSIYYEGVNSLRGPLINGDVTSEDNAYFSSIHDLEIYNIGSFIGDQYIKSYYDSSLSIDYDNLLFDGINYQANIKTSTGLLTNHFWIYFNELLGVDINFNFSNIYFLNNDIEINYLENEVENVDTNFSFLIGEMVAVPPSKKEDTNYFSKQDDIDPSLTLNFHGIFFDSNTVEFSTSLPKQQRNSNATFSFLTKFNLLKNNESEGNVDLLFKPKFSDIFIQNNVIKANNKMVTTYLLFNTSFYDVANAEQLTITRKYYFSDLLILNNTFEDLSFHEWVHDDDLLVKDIQNHENIYYISPTYKTDFYINNQMNLITKGFDLIAESGTFKQIEVIDYLQAYSPLYNKIYERISYYFNYAGDQDLVLKTDFIPVYDQVLIDDKNTQVVSRFSAKFATSPSYLDNWKNTITYNRQKDVVSFDFKFSLNLGINFNQEKPSIVSANLYSNNQLVANTNQGSELDRNNNYSLTFNFIEKINFEDFIYSDLTIDVVFVNQTDNFVLKQISNQSNFFVLEPLSKDGLNLKKDYFLEVNVIIILSLLLLLFIAVILAIIFRLNANKKREKKAKEEIFITTNPTKKSFKSVKQKRIDYQPVLVNEPKQKVVKPKYLTAGDVYQNSEYVDANKNKKQKISRKWKQQNKQYDSFKDYNQYSSDDYYSDQFSSTFEPNNEASHFEQSFDHSEPLNSTSIPVEPYYYEENSYPQQAINNDDIYTLDEFDEWENFN